MKTPLQITTLSQLIYLYIKYNTEPLEEKDSQEMNFVMNDFFKQIVENRMNNVNNRSNADSDTESFVTAVGEFPEEVDVFYNALPGIPDPCVCVSLHRRF